MEAEISQLRVRFREHTEEAGQSHDEMLNSQKMLMYLLQPEKQFFKFDLFSIG